MWRQWLKEKGVKMVFIDPFYNYTNAVMGGKWIAPRLGTDTAIAMAIAHVWITEDTYNKDYVADRTIGFDKFKPYVMGETDGVPKTPEWAEEESGVDARVDPHPGPRMGGQADHPLRRLPRRRGRRVPDGVRHRVGPHDGAAAGHAGPGRTGPQHLGHHDGRSLRHHHLVPGLRRAGRPHVHVHQGRQVHPAESHQAAPLASHGAGSHPRRPHGVARRRLLRQVAGAAVHPLQVPDGGLLRRSNSGTGTAAPSSAP